MAQEAEKVEPVLLSAKDAGRIASVSAWSIYHATKKGELPAFRLGARGPLRWRREDVLAWARPVGPRTTWSA